MLVSPAASHLSRQVTASHFISFGKNSMTGNPYIDSIISLIGGVSAILNILGVIGLLFLKTQYSRVLNQQKHDLALVATKHEADIKARYEIEAELLRSNLQQIGAQKSFLFTSIYSKREEILVKLYQKLTDALHSCNIAHSPSNESLVEPAYQKMLSLHAEMDFVAIYFTEDFVLRWNRHVADVAGSLMALKIARETQTQNWAEDRQSANKAFMEYISAFRSVTTILRGQIRELIGIRNFT